MATTLSRRIRRIGLLRSSYKQYDNGNGKTRTVRTHNFDPTLTPELRDSLAGQLRKQAKARRLAAKAKLKAASAKK